MRKILLALLISSFLGFLFLSPVSSKNDDNNIPEEDGVYDVPGHPNLKLRVVVHNAKPPDASNSLICGLTDPDSSSVVDPTGWYLPSSWTYNLNTGSVPSSVGSANLSTIASDAFIAWSNASGIVFARGSDTTMDRARYDSQNIVAWGRTQGTALAVTYTWYYTDTKQVAEVDTIMNKKFKWSWTPYDSTNLCADNKTYDAQDILTHELGHWMGLDDEYTVSYVNNTMYGYGSKGEIKKDTLTQGDISGIQAIYIH